MPNPSRFIAVQPSNYSTGVAGILRQCDVCAKATDAANFLVPNVVYTREGGDDMLRISQYEWSFSNTAEAATALLLATAIVLALFK